ncbi:hypothetical protein BAE44_0004127 [Dichanthelium oligosanthes]|uniref:Uncharacterized protein n=1 Tax=Dichanthelium oligosanthes TaxID=888268 RepID=A0A1E5WBT8_9POAL|nr:hypothetical protein BAE44_0004127 [Dichanthelium oligosanthes]
MGREAQQAVSFSFGLRQQSGLRRTRSGSSDLLLRCGGGHGHYRPAAAVTGACALRWLPLAAAASAVRALLGASREDLRLRSQQMSRSLGGAFFDRDAAAAMVSPFGGRAVPGGRPLRLAELPPLWPALQAVQRALLQVLVSDGRWRRVGDGREAAAAAREAGARAQHGREAAGGRRWARPEGEREGKEAQVGGEMRRRPAADRGRGDEARMGGDRRGDEARV